MSEIFISHSSGDDAIAQQVLQRLADEGHHSTFLDFDPEYGIPAGRDWERELYQQLRSCRAVIVLCSEHSMSSRWCFAEITHAKSLGKAVFPVKVAPCEIDPVLTSHQIVDLTSDKEEAYRSLWRGLVQAGIDPAGTFVRNDRRPPYPGLLAFQEEDAAVYFGRGPEIQQGLETLQRLRQFGGAHLLMVLGVSGCGKSSLVRAGLVPRLRRNPNQWLIVSPFRPGERPLQELAIAFSETFAAYGQVRHWKDLRGLLETAAEEETRAADVLRDLALDLLVAANRSQSTVLLVIDQLEELLGPTDRSSAERFLAMLRTAMKESGCRLMALCTLRSDFLGAFQQHPGARGFEFEDLRVGPMSADRLIEVIEGPARVVGLELGQGLTQAMIEDARTDDVLPLLAFALAKLYERYGDDGHLGVEEYRDGLGGLAGSIAQTADSVLAAEALSEGQKQDLRTSLMSMVRLSDEGQFVRRSVNWSEVPESVHGILERFVNSRLLISGGDRGERTLEVAHEALFRNWTPLSAWLDESREFLLWRRRLAEVFREWKRTDQDPDTLLAGPALDEGRTWLARRRDQLATEERDFIKKSLTVAMVRRRRRLFVGGVVVLTIFLAALVAVYQRNVAMTNAQVALSRQLAVQATNQLNQQLDLALLLSVEAVEASGTFEARDALLKALLHSPRLTAFLSGHTETVVRLSFSPDGLRLASASEDGSVRLWDPIGATAIGAPLNGHQSKVSGVRFSPTDELLASADVAGQIILWDLRSRPPVGNRLLPVSDDPVQSLAFSPNGRTLAAGTQSPAIVLWDIPSRKPIGQPLKPTGDFGLLRAVSRLMFGPDGQILASGIVGDGVIFWNMSTRRPVARVRPNETSVCIDFALSSTGNTLALACVEPTEDKEMPKAQVTLRNVATGESLGVSRIFVGGVASVTFSPDGTLLVAGGGPFTTERIDPTQIDVLNGATLQSVRNPFEGHQGSVIDVVFSPDGTKLASTGSDRKVLLWDMTDAVPLGHRLVGHKTEVPAVAFSPDGLTLATLDQSGVIMLWDVTSRRPARGPLVIPRPGGLVRSLAFSPDGRWLIAGGAPRRRESAVERISEAQLFRWDVTSNYLPVGEPLSAHDEIVKIAFSPNGDRLATAGRDGVIILWDTNKWRRVHPPMSGHSGPVDGLMFSPDGNRLTSASNGSQRKTIMHWNVSTGQPVAGPITHGECMASAAVTQDGKILAVGCRGENRISLVATDSGQVRGGELMRHTDNVESLAFTPNGDLLASGGADGSILLWEATSSQRLGERLLGHRGRVETLSFSPTGSLLASASEDGSVILWDVNVTSWQARACRIANRPLTASELRQLPGGEAYRGVCEKLR